MPRVLDYAKDAVKTENSQWSKTDYQTMRDVMDYAMNDFKTEQQYFVTALNCNTECAREQMQITKDQFVKTKGILAWHGYQSFVEGELNAKTAHEIGIQLAKELWPDFQVIVATHLNTKCLHNHFVLNSVSYLHGNKFYGNKESYAKMRVASDRLCKAYGLSVIKEKAAYYPKHYAEWDAEQKGQPTWRSSIRTDVDAAILGSVNFDGFVRNLKERGYEVERRGSFLRVRPNGKERFVRLRSLGEQYTEEAIVERIIRQKWPIRPPKPEQKNSVLNIRVQGDYRLSKVTWKGLRALYFFYRRKLREASRQQSSYTPFALRDDIRKLGATDTQMRFLFKHKIDTESELASYRDTTTDKIADFVQQRQIAKNEMRRANVSDDQLADKKAQLAVIAGELKTLRRDIKLCDAIVVRSLEIAEKMKQIKEIENKEVKNKHEPTRRSSRTNRQYGD